MDGISGTDPGFNLWIIYKRFQKVGLRDKRFSFYTIKIWVIGLLVFGIKNFIIDELEH